MKPKSWKPRSRLRWWEGMLHSSKHFLILAQQVTRWSNLEPPFKPGCLPTASNVFLIRSATNLEIQGKRQGDCYFPSPSPKNDRTQSQRVFNATRPAHPSHIPRPNLLAVAPGAVANGWWQISPWKAGFTGRLADPTLPKYSSMEEWTIFHISKITVRDGKTLLWKVNLTVGCWMPPEANWIISPGAVDIFPTNLLPVDFKTSLRWLVSMYLDTKTVVVQVNDL